MCSRSPTPSSLTVPLQPDPPLRVLLTNRVLAQRTGTELYIRDLAIGLLRRGHLPVVYSPRLGALAAEIRRHTIPVVDELSRVAEPPDIIHGHHGLETLTALLAFPGVPAISVCHSWIGWADQPVIFPRIGRYVAVDDTCRHRLVAEHGVSPERVEVVLNAVELSRFRPRSPLPPRPQRALIFSNSSGQGAPHVRAIREACDRTGIKVDIAGFKSGRLLERPEEVLGSYDLVFAKARAALEAAAVGTAVVLCDVAGAGPMITTDNLSTLRRLNFGMRALSHVPSVDGMTREIARYDPADAATVAQRVREFGGQEALLDQLLALYTEVLGEPARSDPDEEARAAAMYLRQLSPKLHDRELLQMAFKQLLRMPLAGRLIRRRAAGEDASHWLPELLRAMDAD